MAVVLATTGAAEDGTGWPPAATLALAGMSIVTVLAIVSVAVVGPGGAADSPAASTSTSWEACRTPSAGGPTPLGPAALASLPFGFAFVADFTSIPGSTCRTASPMTISPLTASKRLNNTSSRCGPPTWSQGSQKL